MTSLEIIGLLLLILILSGKYLIKSFLKPKKFIAIGNKNHKRLILILSMPVLILVLSVIFFKGYSDWKNSIESLENAIMSRNISADSLFTELKTKTIKFSSINVYEEQVKNIAFEHHLDEAQNYFSLYHYNFYGNSWTPKQSDSISDVLNNIKALEQEYKSFLNPENHLRLNISKLKGLEKLIFGLVDSKGYFLDESIRSREKVSAADSDKGSMIVFEYEDEASEILKSIDSLRNSVFEFKGIEHEKYILNQEKFNSDPLTQSFYFQFLFNPNMENFGQLKNLMNPKDKHFVDVLNPILWRIMDGWNPLNEQIELETIWRDKKLQIDLKNSSPTNRFAFEILKYYATTCTTCGFSEYPFFYFLNTVGVMNILSGWMATLTIEKSEVQKVFRNLLTYNDDYTYHEEYLHLLFKNALYLKNHETEYEFIRFRNNLKSILEKSGFDENRLVNLDNEYKESIAAIYLWDSQIRLAKKDYKAGIEDFEELDRLYGFVENDIEKDIFNSRKLGTSISLLLSAWYASSTLLTNIQSCIYLKRASDYNPEEYYEKYITECLKP